MQIRAVFGASLDLSEDSGNRGLGEVLVVILHILLGVFIRGHEHELEATKGDDAAEEEVALLVVGASLRVDLLLALHEPSANSAGVLVTDFVDLDGVVTAVERDDEVTRLIIRLSADESGVEPQDMHVLLEHLLHVDLGSLRVQRIDRAQRVLSSAVTIVRRNLGLSNDWRRNGQLDRLLIEAHHGRVPALCEVVTVVDEAVTTVDMNLVAAEQVLRTIELLRLQVHARTVGQDRFLRQFLLLEQHRERVVTRVLSDNLLNLDAAVRQVVVEDEELVATVVALVLPEDVEAQHLAVVVEERLKVLVRAATLQVNLDVLLDLCLVGRRLLEVDHGTGVSEVVVRETLRLVELNALLSVESLRELIAVTNAENATVDIQVLGNVQILPSVVLGLVLWER